MTAFARTSRPSLKCTSMRLQGLIKWSEIMKIQMRHDVDNKGPSSFSLCNHTLCLVTAVSFGLYASLPTWFALISSMLGGVVKLKTWKVFAHLGFFYYPSPCHEKNRSLFCNFGRITGISGAEQTPEKPVLEQPTLCWPWDPQEPMVAAFNSWAFMWYMRQQ